MITISSGGVVVGYVRVSTQNQVDHGEGLEIQRRKILDYCKEKNFNVDRFYEDKGISGAIRERPALLVLLKDCEAGKVNKVIVYKNDRLSRELTIALWLETQFKKHNVEVVSVADPAYDLEDPLQKAFKRIADVFAELEKEIITVRLEEGRINNAKNGERGSGAVPFGYRKIGDKLEVEPNEVQWVSKIFRWRAKGWSYTKIISELDNKNVMTKRSKTFSIGTLKYILSNKMYYGETNFGDIASKGNHEAIISKRLFMCVQRQKPASKLTAPYIV
ncbi:MAG: recombinase family protein [Candidatus Omnitrophica bacterium]|nr:recombinase family protein [Candidatus Omnitrophota bacterium]